MTKEQINKVYIGTMLIHEPTQEPFRVTGYNELEKDNGTLKEVTGIDKQRWCWIYSLDKCYFSDDMRLMD